MFENERAMRALKLLLDNMDVLITIMSGIVVMCGVLVSIALTTLVMVSAAKTSYDMVRWRDG